MIAVIDHFFDSRLRESLMWGILALGLGLTIVMFPGASVFVVLSLVAFCIFASVTPLAALMVLLVIAPIRTLFMTESTLQLPMDLGQIAVAGLMAAWFVHRVVRRRQLALGIFRSPVALAVIFFVGVTGALVFAAVSPGAWLREWLKWVQILLLVVIVYDLGGNRRWEWLLFGLVLAGVVNALVGIYEYFGGSGAEHLLIDGRHFRAFGTFGQPNPFGGFLGLLAPLALAGVLGYGQRAWRIWCVERRFSSAIFVMAYYAAALGIMSLGIFFSWSRGAWLAFVVSMTVVIFALPRHIWQSVLFAGLMAAMVGVLWFSGFLPASVVDRIASSSQELFTLSDVRGVDISTENYAVVERLAHWQAALNMIERNPWFGVGFGGYEVVYPDYQLLNWGEPLGHAHNYYLNVWAETGIIGLAAYLLFWGGVVWLAWRLRDSWDVLGRSVGVGLLGVCAYLFVHSVFDNLYVNNVFLCLGVMLGILAVLYAGLCETEFWSRYDG
jgi:putative inorganic carbon (hco3(-)) transporter